MFFPLAVNLHGKSLATSLSLALNLHFTFTFITSTSVGEVWQLFNDSVFQKSFFNKPETKPPFDLTLFLFFKWNELINKFDYYMNITRTELDFFLFFLKSLLVGYWVRATVWIELGYCKLGYFDYNLLCWCCHSINWSHSIPRVGPCNSFKPSTGICPVDDCDNELLWPMLKVTVIISVAFYSHDFVYL